MNALKCLFLFFTIFSSMYCSFVQAQGTQQITGQNQSNKAITTAVPFLNITSDSRAAGMGDAGVATSPDINSAYWNAAKLGFIQESNGASLSYTPWLAKIVNDMFIVYLSGFYKINKVQTVASSMKYFNIGETFFNTGPDENDQIGRFNPREFALDFTYSRILTNHLSIGGSLRYIHSNLTGDLALGGGTDGKPGNSVAVDLGFFFTKPSKSNQSILSLGASITNIGAKMSYSSAENVDFIPTNLRLGGAYLIKLNLLHSLTLALDINKLLVPSPAEGSKDKNLLEGIFGSFGDAQGGFSEEMKEITLSVGVEYWYKKTFSGRLGYFLEDDEKGSRKYLTIGVGAKVRRFGMDIAYISPTNGRESPLAETVRFTLMMNFGKKKRSKSENIDTEQTAISD